MTFLLRFAALVLGHLSASVSWFWRGYLLLPGVCRDKWLKDTGMMFPSHATMVWAVVDDGEEKMRKDDDLKK